MVFRTTLSLAALFVAEAEQRTQIAYIGSGGCDGQDVGCVDDPEQQHIIQAVEVSDSGELRALPDFAIPTGGAPVWLIPHASPAGEQCLFVTLADLDEVAAYTVSPHDGTHKLVGKYKSGGAAPVHGSIIGKDILLVANYHGPDDAQTSDGAAAASLRIHDDCSLELADSKPHSGSSSIPWRQGGAHVHSFNADSNRKAYACDLGMDKIFTYDVAPNGTLKELSTIDVEPGLGPRHAVQVDEYMYVVNEMGQAVTAYHKNEDGSLTLNQTLELVRLDRMTNLSKAAEIVGKPGDEHHAAFLYATNRGERNTVSVLAIGNDGAMRQVSQVEAPLYPRGMTLAHEGKVLLVAGQSKTELVSFRVGALGSLERTEFRLDASSGLPPNPAAFAVIDAPPPVPTVTV